MNPECPGFGGGWYEGPQFGPLEYMCELCDGRHPTPYEREEEARREAERVARRARWSLRRRIVRSWFL